METQWHKMKQSIYSRCMYWPIQFTMVGHKMHSNRPMRMKDNQVRHVIDLYIVESLTSFWVEKAVKLPIHCCPFLPSPPLSFNSLHESLDDNSTIVNRWAHISFHFYFILRLSHLTTVNVQTYTDLYTHTHIYNEENNQK